MRDVKSVKQRFEKNARGFFTPTEKGKIVHPWQWWLEMHAVAPFKEKLLWDVIKLAKKEGRAFLGYIKGLECWVTK